MLARATAGGWPTRTPAMACVTLGSAVRRVSCSTMWRVPNWRRCPRPTSAAAEHRLFAVKQAPISEAMLGRKLNTIAEAGVELVVTGDASCMTQIAGGLSRAGARTRVRHIAEVLANMVDAR